MLKARRRAGRCGDRRRQPCLADRWSSRILLVGQVVREETGRPSSSTHIPSSRSRMGRGRGLEAGAAPAVDGATAGAISDGGGRAHAAIVGAAAAGVGTGAALGAAEGGATAGTASAPEPAAPTQGTMAGAPGTTQGAPGAMHGAPGAMAPPASPAPPAPPAKRPSRSKLKWVAAVAVPVVAAATAFVVVGSSRPTIRRARNRRRQSRRRRIRRRPRLRRPTPRAFDDGECAGCTDGARPRRDRFDGRGER